MTAVAVICLVLLAVGGAGCLARLVTGPSLVDRVVALDTGVLVLVAGVAVGAAVSGSGFFVDVVVVGTLIGFVSTLTVARFVERRGARDEGEAP
jgi:multicomponent Na+:H+ antiporter subunit F